MQSAGIFRNAFLLFIGQRNCRKALPRDSVKRAAALPVVQPDGYGSVRRRPFELTLPALRYGGRFTGARAAGNHRDPPVSATAAATFCQLISSLTGKICPGFAPVELHQPQWHDSLREKACHCALVTPHAIQIKTIAQRIIGVGSSPLLTA